MSESNIKYNLIKKIVDLIKTIFFSFRMYLRGNGFYAPENIVVDRLNICRKCEHFSGNRLRYYKCNVCGCYVNEKVKYFTSSCPIEKWDEVDINI